MVRIKLKVGPKGQIVIPKMLRESYGIKEGNFIIIELKDEGLMIKNIAEPSKIFRRIIEWKRKVRGKPAKLGELKHVDLEDEFE